MSRAGENSGRRRGDRGATGVGGELSSAGQGTARRELRTVRPCRERNDGPLLLTRTAIARTKEPGFGMLKKFGSFAASTLPSLLLSPEFSANCGFANDQMIYTYVPAPTGSLKLWASRTRSRLPSDRMSAPPTEPPAQPPLRGQPPVAPSVPWQERGPMDRLVLTAAFMTLLLHGTTATGWPSAAQKKNTCSTNKHTHSLCQSLLHPQSLQTNE